MAIIDARIQHKHDTEAKWNEHPDFVPMIGELIVYDKDSVYNYARFKIGDGVTPLNSLPFTLDIILDDAKEYIDNVILNGEW